MGNLLEGHTFSAIILLPEFRLLIFLS